MLGDSIFVQKGGTSNIQTNTTFMGSTMNINLWYTSVQKMQCAWKIQEIPGIIIVFTNSVSNTKSIYRKTIHHAQNNTIFKSI